MRTFSITYSVPATCDCCGAALPVPAGGVSPGTYELTMPEGKAPTDVRFGEVMKVTLSAGKLEVRLRQTRGSCKQWSVKPLYNSGVFAKERSTTDCPAGVPDFYWQIFTFDLLDYKPDFTTWWAELQFVEVPFGTRAQGGNLSTAHNTAGLKVRILTLD